GCPAATWEASPPSQAGPRSGSRGERGRRRSGRSRRQRPETSRPAEVLSQILREGGADLRMAETELHVGHQVAELVAGVESLGIDHRVEHTRAARQIVHGVGQLDLTSAPWCTVAYTV